MANKDDARNATLPFTDVLNGAKKVDLFNRLQEVEVLLHELRHVYSSDLRRTKPLDWWLSRMEPIRPLQGGRVWRFYGLTFTFNDTLAAATLLLWEHRDVNDGWVSGEFLTKELGLLGTRFIDLCRNKGKRHESWGILIGFDGRGNYRVNRQPPSSLCA